MIITLNPSLDRTIELDRLAQSCAQRVTAVRLPGTQMPGPADIDRSVVHILSDPVPALLTPVTKGES